MIWNRKILLPQGNMIVWKHGEYVFLTLLYKITDILAMRETRNLRIIMFVIIC